MTNMIPTDLLPFVDHVAARDDRRRFVTSPVVFNVFAAFVMPSSRIKRNKV